MRRYRAARRRVRQTEVSPAEDANAMANRLATKAVEGIDADAILAELAAYGGGEDAAWLPGDIIGPRLEALLDGKDSEWR